jgi:hypothetical protein
MTSGDDVYGLLVIRRTYASMLTSVNIFRLRSRYSAEYLLELLIKYAQKEDNLFGKLG